MVLIPSIPAQATALANDLAASTRRMFGRIEFDWNRDGLYTHAYSDLTEIWTSCGGDRGMVTDLPDAVSTPDGYSSGQMNATLSGSLGATSAHIAIGAAALFDPDNRNSPIFDKNILGTPVRYSRVTQTVVGDVVLPVFTGFVRSAPFQRVANSVAVTAADHLDLANGIVTLPLWAVPTASPYSTWNWVSGPATRPIRLTWAIEEILRQAGRPVAPTPRADCVAMFTCSGSMLPSFGYGNHNDYQQLGYSTVHEAPLGYPPPWVTAPFGLAPNVVSVLTDPNDMASGTATCNRAVAVTTDGSGAPTNRVGVGEWVYISSAADATYPSVSRFYIGNYNMSEEHFDPLFEDPGNVSEFIQLEIHSNGTVRTYVRESPAMAGWKYWDWNTVYALADGWHYFNLIYSFSSTTVTAALTIDGASQSMTQVNSPAGGFRYRSPAPTQLYANGGVLRSNKVNVASVHAGGPPVHQVQFYAGDSTLAFSSQQITAPTLTNGKPAATVAQSSFEIFWLPDIYQDNPWEVLKQITAAYCAGLYIDEYGTVHWEDHGTLRLNVSAAALSAISVTDQQLDEMTVTPTDDSQRNTVVVPWTFRNAEEGTVWTQKNARDRPINVGGLSSVLEPVKEVISTSDRIIKVSETPVDNSSLEPDHRTGWASAVELDDPSSAPPANDWSANTFMPDQRTLGLVWFGPSFGVPLFIGSYLEANQASWNVAGAKYSAAVSALELVEDTPSVVAVGRKTLTLSSSPWVSMEVSGTLIGFQLLQDLLIPASTVSPLRLPADPRRQLLDVLRVTNDSGSSGAFYGQIINKSWDDSCNGDFFDTLTLRMTSTPGTFILDDAEYGVLDSANLLG